MSDGYVDAWVLVQEGRIDGSCTVFGNVHDLNWTMLDQAYEDICESLSEMDGQPPNAVAVNVRLSNFYHHEGQQSFPETGQWDFLPYWEFDVEILSYEYDPEPSK